MNPSGEHLSDSNISKNGVSWSNLGPVVRRPRCVRWTSNKTVVETRI